VRIATSALDRLCVHLFAHIARIVLAMLLASAPAHAAPRAAASLPAGWTIDGGDLVWSSATPLRIGAARYEFRSGERLLGYPRQRGNRLRLPLTSSWSLVDLSVWAGGRRIDAPAPHVRYAEPPMAEPQIAQVETETASPGPYRIQRLRYELAGLEVEDYPAPLEVLAEVTTPLGARRPRPLVLFLHGKHSTCYRGGPTGPSSGDWPCPPGWRAVPSYQGYRYIADVLASKGYLTVSISANGINGQDGMFVDGGAAARSSLVRHHLRLWAEWATIGGDPWGGRFLGRVDMHKVALVGHSRGGEGVERAAIDTNPDDPWRIQGLLLIGPTAFNRQVAAGVHTTVVLPFCDGDVTTLEGQQYVDIGRDLIAADPALRSSVMAMGTNHNFYNTEWTPGLSKAPAWDDWFDPSDAQCGENRTKRLTPAEQQAVGLAYTAALVDLALADDLSGLRFLDGTLVKPASIGRAKTYVHAIGGDKQLLYAAGIGPRVSARGLTASECRGYFNAGPFDQRSGCAQDLTFEVLPHWLPMNLMDTAAAPRALEVAWQSAGGAVEIPVNRDLSGVDALDLRIAGHPAATPVDLAIRLRDASGRVADLALRPPRLQSFRGPAPLGKVEARQLRVSLEDVGIDLSNVSSLELLPQTAHGQFWLLDASTWRNSLGPSDQVHLPRISVGDVAVPEGDAGEKTVEVPVRIDGTVTRRARLWVQLTDYSNFTDPTRGFPLVLEPGQTTASIPITYRADDVFNPYPRQTLVTLLARRNAVTADYDAVVEIEDDDPPPRLTVDARQVSAAEGSALEWTFRLSAPMGDSVFWSIEVIAPTAQFIELDSDDLPRSFLLDRGIDPPDPALPLSQLGLFFGIEFAAGEREKTVTIPIDRDGISEPLEGVMLRLDGFGDPVVPRPIELKGLVPAN
jgi:hypothetical protein